MLTDPNMVHVCEEGFNQVMAPGRSVIIDSDSPRMARLSHSPSSASTPVLP